MGMKISELTEGRWGRGRRKACGSTAWLHRHTGPPLSHFSTQPLHKCREPAVLLHDVFSSDSHSCWQLSPLLAHVPKWILNALYSTASHISPEGTYKTNTVSSRSMRLKDMISLSLSLSLANPSFRKHVQAILTIHRLCVPLLQFRFPWFQ